MTALPDLVLATTTVKITMRPDFADMDPFCRISVQAGLPHHEFVALSARCVDGSSHMNSVRSRTLDISVHENDVFDADKSHRGKDRWLYFRYTLEVDSVEGVAPGDYIASIGALLEVLWSSCMEAVASCEFEDQLPRNERRSKWVTA